ncbi:MAG: ketopantoate reductase family protein [Treponema sp.]|nr:ketopantoate reductase family protein [Treponema sp.]
MIKNVTMIGMGAVGAIVGEALTTVLGKDNVECICEGERKARYDRDGICINGVRKDFKYVTPEEVRVSDLVIIATKNLQMDQVLVQIKNAVGPKTTILSLLNGIQSEKDLEAVYGKERVIYGFIIGLSSVHEGNNIICSDTGTIVYGEDDNSKSERIIEIGKLFDAAGQKAKNPEDIHLEQWKKYLMNVTCNTVTSLCRAPYGTFKNEVLCDVVRQAAKEVIAVANAEGVALNMDHMETNIRIMDSIDPRGKTSMYQDIEARRKTENGWFCGTVVKLGEKYGIPTPTCALLEKLVAVTEAAWEFN